MLGRAAGLVFCAAWATVAWAACGGVLSIEDGPVADAATDVVDAVDAGPAEATGPADASGPNVASMHRSHPRRSSRASPI
jgi:hypothetical protein